MKPELKAPEPVAKRYSKTPLPPYRFIPGHNAHPTRHPQGHAFGREHVPVPEFVLKDWAANEKYLYGVDLYNAAFWWESHEAWEDVWKALDRTLPAAQFLQGLIQISAAFIKWYSDDIIGVEKLFALGIARLESVAAVTPNFMGVDLPKHLHDLRNHFHPVIFSEETHFDPLIHYPFLKLEGF